MRTTVVRRSDRTETLLSGGIPDLKLDSLSVELDGADFLFKRITFDEKEGRIRTFVTFCARRGTRKSSTTKKGKLTKSTPMVEM